MVKITIDFETKSELDVRKVGPWAYAAHPSTEIFCMAYKIGNEETRLWTPKMSQVMSEGFSLGNHIFEAHNAEFERAIWHHVCHKKYGWPDIPIVQWRCSAAKASALSLPRSLEMVAKALDLSVQKDMKGHMLMLKLSKPRRPRKAEKIAWIQDKYSKIYGKDIQAEWVGEIKLKEAEQNMPTLWHGDPEDLERLFKYCVQDVKTEHQASETMRDLSVAEQQLWFLDQKINQRGVYIDVEAAHACLNIIGVCEKELLEELQQLTGDHVKSPRQVKEMIKWFKKQGLRLADLTKASVSKALELDLPNHIRRILEIRQSMGLSSLAKIPAMLRGMNEDHRVRGTMMFHGSHTGRWAGRRLQPHNMTRGTIKDVDNCIEVIKSKNIPLLKMLYGDPLQAISSCIRGLICASPGNDLVCADFSSIEARVNAWLAGEQWVLDSFIAGHDLYKVAAAKIYHKEYDDITKNERAKGKISELACGYQGAVGAFQKMSKTYGVDLPDEEAQIIVDEWRASHPKIKQFWWSMEEAAKQAVKTGKTQTWGLITWGVHDDYLFCKLPSGRFMAYNKPRVEVKTIKPEKDKPWTYWKKECLTYMGMNSMTYKWERQTTYGGKLVENIVQAVSRDILVESFFRAEKAGYPIVLHVHDESIAEIPERFGSLEEFENIMAEVPVWAEGLPIGASGWRGKRYRKD